MEYTVGNGDGIWAEVSIKKVAFRAVFTFLGVGLLAWLLFFGKSWIQSALVSLITFILFYLILEGVFGLLLRLRPDPVVAPNVITERLDTQNSSIPDSLLGYRAKPGFSVDFVAKVGNKVFDTIRIHIDSLSRRVVPMVPKPSAPINKYALFFGCSFTYGEGVDEKKTMPYYFSQLTGYHAYNYGFSGYSPLHMLGLLQSRNLPSEVEEKEGVAIYTYINHHINRVTPHTHWLRFMDGRIPYLNPKTMVIEGTIANKQPTKKQLIDWMYKSNIREYFAVGFPGRYYTHHYQRMVDVVRKSKELYQAQFKNNNFYLLIFPGQPMEPEMKKLFQEAGIQMLDYSNLFDSRKYMLPFDASHPNGEAYRMVMEKLAKDLKL
ncbi:hypothetical protein [Larkinella terrae]|uniref:SGNH/GDSL hydrolase family protein n=1 Tax=Larkinella terrae TaxID=2025311 RepID=A0A7K0ED52_9BACT|nr:hypothetical protein [Larkinella terrae]MRS59823.1 hypothetical protein [Larkinella terrae]